MIDPALLAAFGLYLVRTSVMVLASPLLGASTTFSGAKVALIAVLSLALFAATGEPLARPIGPLEFGVLAAREALIGLALGYVIQAAMLAVRVAGEMIGNEMGLNMASQIDPESGINTPLVTRFYEGLFLVGLFALDGHHLLIRALAESFGRAPVGDLAGVAGIAGVAETLLRETFSAGIAFAMPVLVLMTITSILLALMARAMPQLNVMDLGFTLRIGIGLIALYAFAPLFADAIDGLHATLANGLEAVLAAAEG